MTPTNTDTEKGRWMGEWNFDLTNIPRGRRETRTQTFLVKGEERTKTTEIFIAERVLLAHPEDGKVYSTYWVEPTKWTPKGRWNGWCEGQEPKAWMPYPVHPDLKSTPSDTQEQG